MTPMTDGPECDCPPRAGGACHMHAADYYRAEADRLRAALARRDTTTAALLQRCEEIDDTTWTADGSRGGSISTNEVWAALSAPVEAGTPARHPADCPSCSGMLSDRDCDDRRHEGAEAGAPAAEPAPDRPGICPTCESSQPHLHPHRDLCSDPWHKPVPTTVDGWRREVERWAGLLHQIAEFGSGIPDVRRSADLIADDISRALAGPADDTTREAADV